MAQTAQININVNAKQATDTVGQLNAELNQTTKSFNSMKAELRAVTQELQGLDPGSARFKELSTRAGQLRDTISDTNQVINATAGNLTENFGRALGSSVQLGVAGFQGLLSVQTLFGVENENLQKTLNQFGALLNLTQAIETFGGLSDKLTQIKAGFTPVLQALGLMATTQTEVAVATGAADAALVGEAVAADGAAVSTGFFATALNALPLVAIVTALGLLVAGLISYASTSNDAAKQEEERKKLLEETRKQQEANNEAQKAEINTIAESSKAYVGLIYQLKATNAGSKERNDLIKEINSEYGTTLKNIKDEATFQNQLNTAVVDYINFQKQKLVLTQYEDKTRTLLEKQIKLEKELRRLQDPMLLSTWNKETLKGGDVQARVAEETKKLEEQLTNVYFELEKYGKLSLKVSQEIDDKYVPATNNSTDATDKNTEALQRQKDALSNLQSLYARQIEAEKELEAIRQGQMKVYLSSLQNGIEQTFMYTSKFYQDTFEIEQNYRDKQANLIEQATQREVEVLDQQFVDKKVSEETYLKLRRQIQQEGIKNLTESEKSLYGEYSKLMNKDVAEYARNYASKQLIAQESTKAINKEIEILTLEFTKEQRIRDIENSQLTEEEKNKKILSIRKEFLAHEIKLIEERRDLQIKLLNEQREDEVDNAELTDSEKYEINAKYNKQLLELTQTTQTEIQDLTAETTEVQKTQVEKLTESLDKVDDILGAIQDVYSQFESAITNLTAANTEKRTQLIEDAANEQMAILDSQLQQRLITEEEYNNQKTQLEQEQEQQGRALAKKEFETNKKLNLVSATIDGARAVISTFGSTPGGIVIKSIAAGLAAAFAAIQIGVIKNSVFTAATGGIVPGSGSGDIDSVPANLAPGEAVINSRSTSRFLPVLSAINMAEGGRSLMPNLPSVNQGQTFQTVYASNQPQQPIRAYVVESDVSDAQRRVQRIENSTRF